MAKDDNKHIQPEKKEHDNPISQPDPETLHKTDPQENMKGPISSLVNKAKENIEENDEENKAVDKEE
jgi:hypothetical protein